jgi:hypothetical protein
MKRIIPHRTLPLVIKVFRLFGINIGSKEPPRSNRDDVHMPNQPKTFNVQAYMLGKRRTHEIEGEKAMVIAESRHDKWKAGGAL